MIVWLLFFTICIYSALDVYTTWEVMGIGIKEMNPLLVPLIDKFGCLNALILVKGVWLIFLAGMLLEWQHKFFSKMLKEK